MQRESLEDIDEGVGVMSRFWERENKRSFWRFLGGGGVERLEDREESCGAKEFSLEFGATFWCLDLCANQDFST